MRELLTTLRPAIGRWLLRMLPALAGLEAQALPGPELTPPSAVIATPDGGEIREVRTGQADDGRAVVVFTTRNTVNVQRLAADGSVGGPPETVLSLVNGEFRNLVLAVGGNGHYALAVQTGLDAAARVFVRRYGPDGTRIVNVGEPEGPIPASNDDPETCALSAVIATSAPAVSVDADGNLAYTFTRSGWCPTGPGGALQPDRTTLIYRHAPIDAPASDGVVLFRQSPVNSGGFRVLGSIGSSIALQPGGAALVTWMGHEQANERPMPHLRPVSLGLATAAATRIDIDNSFDRSAPLIGAGTGGYTLWWRGEFNDPQTLSLRERCQTLAVGLDAGIVSGPMLVSRCSSDVARRALITRDDGRHDLIVPTFTGWLGTRYAAAGTELDSYSGGVRPNRFLDTAPQAWSPRLAGGNYLAAYLQRAADDSLSEIALARYAGPDGTRALELGLSPASSITISDGRTITLNWRSNAAPGSCFGFGNLGGPLASSGSRTLGSFSTAGIRTYGIACGPGELTKTATLTVTDPDAVTVTVGWNPASVAAGNRATVSWNASNADSCTYELSGALADAGTVAVSGAIEYAFPNAGEARFDLLCSGAGGRSGSGDASIRIAEAQPLSVAASWSPTVIASGGTSTLSWSSVNAVSCTGTLDGLRNETFAVAASGSELFQPGNAAGTQRFTLECLGVDGETRSASAVLTVNAVTPTVSASWTAPVIRVGEAPFVMWSSTNAIACEASLSGLVNNAPFAVEASGLNAVSLPFDMAGTVDFTLSCVGLGGGQASTTARLTVNAVTPTVSASWTAPTIRVGETPFVMWSSTNAIACEASLSGLVNNAPFAVDASGMSAVQLPFNQAGTVDFTLRCIGPGGGEASTTARLTVNAVTPTVSASWTAATIRVGETPFVSWSSTGALGCEASLRGLVDNGPFAVEASGTSAVPLPFNQAGTVDFTLRCVGPGGAAASTTARLTVNAVVPVVSASWVNPSIQVGETPLLMWSSSDAIACQGSFAGLIVDGPFAIGASGMNAVPLPNNTPGTLDFTLDCVGPGDGRAVTTARLTVNALPPPPPPPPANVATVQLRDGGSVQLVSSAGALVNARVVEAPAALPAGFTAVSDFLAFEVSGVPVGGDVEVTLTFPAGVSPNAYVKCTPACAIYPRAFISGRTVRLILTDGGAGDADGVADGVIRDPGAPGRLAPAPGGGSASGALLLALAELLRRLRAGRGGR